MTNNVDDEQMTLFFKDDLQKAVFLRDKRMGEASNGDRNIVSVNDRLKLGTLEVNDGSQYTVMMDDCDQNQIVKHCSDVLANESDDVELTLTRDGDGRRLAVILRGQEKEEVVSLGRELRKQKNVLR